MTNTVATSTRSIPWWLYGVTIGAILAIALLSLTHWGTGPDGWQHVARYTARLAFLIFIITFSAGALVRFFPSQITRWLRRNRRYLGLSFALAHGFHLLALSIFHVVIGEAPGLVSILGGGLAYVFVLLLALTSNDISVRRLGPANWRRLHLVGTSYIWLIFTYSYAGRLFSETPPEPRIIFALLVGLSLAALALRITAWRKRPRASV